MLDLSEVDIVVITIAIFLTNIAKQFIKTKFIYVYLPVIIIILISVVFCFFKIIGTKTVVYFVFKCYALSILLYDAILEKIKNNIKGVKNEENN